MINIETVKKEGIPIYNDNDYDFAKCVTLIDPNIKAIKRGAISWCFYYQNKMHFYKDDGVLIWVKYVNASELIKTSRQDH